LNINLLLDGLQVVTGMHLLDGSFFVQVPVLVLATDLLLITGMSGLLCLLSAWIPARRAAQTNPILALHG
jgi:ABC-type lipoprotein release transport system permease subunit